jgi:hypothetical protein
MNNQTMKTCNVCGETKSLSDYYPTKFKSKQFPDKIYYHGKCKSCFIKEKQKDYTPEKGRDKNLKHLYGITLQEYNTLLEQQNHCCAICESTDPKGRKSGRGGAVEVFYVDHDHNTGKVRGLLCNVCNRTMGYVGENSGVLEEMIKYLQKHQ